MHTTHGIVWMWETMWTMKKGEEVTMNTCAELLYLAYFYTKLTQTKYKTTAKKKNEKNQNTTFLLAFRLCVYPSKVQRQYRQT